MMQFLCLVMTGCLSSPQPTCKPWHISPPQDPKSSEFYALIPFKTACAIRPGMTEDQLKVLVGDAITTTTQMPSFPFFVAKRNDGVFFEVAVKMNYERIVQDVSFKKQEMPNHTSDGLPKPSR